MCISVIKAIEEEERRSAAAATAYRAGTQSPQYYGNARSVSSPHRNQQQQHPFPSKVFQYVDRKFSGDYDQDTTSSLYSKQPSFDQHQQQLQQQKQQSPGKLSFHISWHLSHLLDGICAI